MDFLKKHYEKLLLGVVLVGLAAAIVFLLFKVGWDKQALEDKRNGLIHPRVQALSNLDLTLDEQVLKRLATPATVDFSGANRVFNPQAWQKRPDGGMVPQAKVGPTALTVTNIEPLYLRLTLDSVTVSDAGPRYVIGVEKQAALTPDKRAKRQNYCKLNDKNDTFQLVEVKGNPADPSQLVVILNDTGERATITKEQPFRRVDGYMADLRYDLEKKSWNNRRLGASLSFNGEDYNIVAINRNEVVLSAKSNQKKWTIKSHSNVSP